MKPGLYPIVYLTGKTKKGKERVKQFGNFWCITRKGNPICLNGAPGYFIEPILENSGCRWVAATDDPDFNVELKQEDKTE